MAAPSDRRYLQTHEWHKAESGLITIGITQTAADELTDITFVSLPHVGQTLEVNSRFGEIESVKATSDLYTGVAGTVRAVNEALVNDPGLVNRDPYEKGWMIKVSPSHDADLKHLLSVEEYLKKSGH